MASPVLALVVRRLVILASLLVVACEMTDDEGFDPNYCPSVENWEPAWVALENDVVSLVNERRSEGGVCDGVSFRPAEPLAVDSALRCAARNHSRDMAVRGYFDHVSPEGEDFADRFERAGFDWTRIGENIATGQETAAEVMADWMSSQGHCENILDPNYEFMGVGYYEGDEPMWTQTFGTK
jgi:uncharacterized protein YkwD